VTQRDHRDLVIEELAAELVATDEAREIYRDMALVALERVAELTAKVERLTKRVHQLLEERRQDVAA
jgi:hypothetical protein